MTGESDLDRILARESELHRKLAKDVDPRSEDWHRIHEELAELRQKRSEAMQELMAESSPVVVKCPNTGAVMPTGFRISQSIEEFLAENSRSTVECGSCQQTHVLDATNTFLLEDVVGPPADEGAPVH